MLSKGLTTRQLFNLYILYIYKSRAKDDFMKNKIKELISKIKVKSVTTESAYRTIDLGIRSGDEETVNIMSNTFGVIKNNLAAFWASVGLEPNVNTAYQNTMLDPSKAIENEGKIYYPHPGVGNLKAYNESGHPSGGAFTLSTLG